MREAIGGEALAGVHSGAAGVPVIGIGASAGGLEAITLLVRALDPNLPYAYVVLQHLSPSHRSMMVEILGRESPLAVQPAKDGLVLQAGTIYVVPANRNATLRDGRLRLRPAPPEVVPKPSINDFFVSLAAEAGEDALGIVLSGTGSDGTAGLRAIQAAGGITVVQQPETAKYGGMPTSAIEARVADYVLAPEEIADRLPTIAAMHRQGREPAEREVPHALLEMLRDRRDIDVSGYKRGTLARRIRRRVVASGCSNMDEYVRLVGESDEELDSLTRDVLISVTAFFRDTGAFEELAAAVREICAREPAPSELRIWVAGCATGEEAYSIGMLCAEALAAGDCKLRIQIFATDIDEDALNVARRGVYPEGALAGVPAEYIERYFRPVRDAYEVGKQLRDMILFARHNLVDDPPFPRLDLIACRNVLIYFDSDLQARVLQRFHFALAPGGLLFLGRSESVGKSEAMFRPKNRRERLFIKQGESGRLPGPSPRRLLPAPSARRRNDVVPELLEGIANHFGATVALCDSDGGLLHTAGDVSRFFRFPKGNSQVAVTEMVVQPFRGELLTMLRGPATDGGVHHGRVRQLDDGPWQLSVRRLSVRGSSRRLIVIAPRQSADAEGEGAEGRPDSTPRAALPSADDPAAMHEELVSTREHLQSVTEQLATASEETQSLHEEAQAANEELQAANEEMEAANEELQATNEELISLNQELNVKTDELSRLNEEYTHVYDSLEFPILVFDGGLRLKRYNASAERRFSMRASALRQKVGRLKLPQWLGGLEELLGQALDSREPTDLVVSNAERVNQVVVSPGLDGAGEPTLLIASVLDVTDITRAQHELRQSQARLRTLMENTTIILAMKDLSGRYLFANSRFLSAFDLKPGEYEGRTDFELFPQAFAADVWGSDLQALREQQTVTAEHVFRGGTQQGANAEKRVFRTIHQVLADDDGKPSVIIMESEDITLRKRIERQLRISARVFEQAGEAIVVTDRAGRVQSVNTAFTRITGYQAEEVVGRSIRRMMRSRRNDPSLYDRIWHALENKGFWQGEIWGVRKNGNDFPQLLTVNSITADGSDRTQSYVAVFADITDLKESQRRAEYLATHDALTGLPNRTLFHDRLQAALAQARRKGDTLALMFIDLDNFKSINDTLGHDVGDELLVQVAVRLFEVLREMDTVARMGGDEFTVLLPDTSVETAELVAQRVIDTLSREFEVRDRSLFVTTSAGLAFFPDDGTEMAALIKSADAAMYRAKENGRNRFELFKPELHVELVKQAGIERGLREALHSDRLRLVFQPVYEIGNGGDIVAAEALLRWNDPELGDVSPGDFIPVAENTGLILDVDRKVVELLARQLARWVQANLKPPRVAFNVSARSFQEESFVDHLFEQLARCQVAADQIQIEITESTLLTRSHTELGNVERLREAGVRLAIDDFGTGYSSLSYLKQLPIAELKIDKTFVSGLGNDESDEAISRAILALAEALGVRTVAEGVETEAQLDWLRKQGGDYVQGFVLSGPLPAGDFEQLFVSEAGR